MIGDHPLIVIAPTGHELAGEHIISKDRIAREHFLVHELGSGTRTSLEIYLADIPRRLDNLGTDMGLNETIKQAVMAGLGITSSPRARLSKRLSLAALSCIML